MRRPLVRRIGYGVGGAAAVVFVLFAGLWLRLGAGPIEIDFASPWLASAIEQNIGKSHRVAIAGTQIGDTDGVVVASAPKAEVAVSGDSLLRGELRASRVSLVGAELSVRIEEDGQVTISTGAEKRPLAVTPTIIRPTPPGGESPAVDPAQREPTGAERFAGLIGWLDRISSLGLDGQGLGEIGLKNGTLKVYKGYPHGMLTTHAEVINPDLLAFIKG